MSLAVARGGVLSRAAMLHVVPVYVLIPLCCTSAPTSPTHRRSHCHGSRGKHKTRRRRRRRSRSSSSIQIRMCASSVREHRAAGKQRQLLLHSECSIGSTSESMAYQQVDTLGQQTPHLASHWEPQPNTIKRRTNRVCQYTAGHVASLEDVNSHSSRWSDSSCAQRSSPASSWSLSGASGSMAHQQLCSGVQQPPEFALQPPMDQQGICHQSMEQPHQAQQALRAPGRQGLQAARRQPQMSFQMPQEGVGHQAPQQPQQVRYPGRGGGNGWRSQGLVRRCHFRGRSRAEGFRH